MANHGIRNLETPLNYDNDEFFNRQVYASNTNLYVQVTKDYKANADKSLARRVNNESTNENNIRVLGISDFPDSSHQVNKKAYNIQLILGVEIQYRSRIFFNLHPLPVWYYMMVVEFFPQEMNNVSVTPEAKTISISNYVTNTFTKTSGEQFRTCNWFQISLRAIVK